jgi:hypothetical protein
VSFALTWERWRLPAFLGIKHSRHRDSSAPKNYNRPAVAHWWRVKELIRNYSETLPEAAGYSP